MAETPNIYSQSELAAIQRAIAPPPPALPDILSEMETPPPQWMRPFWKLAGLETELFRRLAADPWVEALSQYAFFPAVMGWRAEGRDIPRLRITGRTRGPAAILHSVRPEPMSNGGEAIVIKPFQNTREDEIAAVAARVNVGPAQLPSLSGYLTEWFAEGVFFTGLPSERRTDNAMRAVGLALGGMLRRLHDAGVYYNDATLADPEGRSHLIVNDDGGCTLIDFGVSLLVSHHPDYTREEVHNFARTLPMYRIMNGMADSRAEMDEFLDGYRRRMAEVSPWDIMARDLKFAQQGLSIAARLMGEGIIAPIRDGFVEGYRPGS